MIPDTTVATPRTVIAWAENLDIFGDLGTALRYTFVNRCDPDDEPVVAELFQRCFDRELDLLAEVGPPEAALAGSPR